MAGFQNGAEREFASHLPFEWRGDVKCSKKCFLIFLLSLPHVSFLIHHFFIKILLLYNVTKRSCLLNGRSTIQFYILTLVLFESRTSRVKQKQLFFFFLTPKTIQCIIAFSRVCSLSQYPNSGEVVVFEVEAGV